MANKKIIVMRHGEKSGDALTAKGAMQAYAAATALGLTYKIDRIYHSGLNRAWQMALITAAALGIKEAPVLNSGLSFEATMKMIFGDGGSAACLAEAKVIKEKGGTVGVARVISPYAHEGGCVMTEAIGKIAYGLGNLQTALCISHSPWLELAAAATTPYCLGECDAVSYLVESDSLIVGSEIIRAPLSGQANV